MHRPGSLKQSIESRQPVRAPGCHPCHRYKVRFVAYVSGSDKADLILAVGEGHLSRAAEGSGVSATSQTCSATRGLSVAEATVKVMSLQ